MDHSLLIQSLAQDLAPVKPDSGLEPLMTAAFVGAGASTIGLVTTLGVQPGLDASSALVPFAGKAALGISMAYVAFKGVIAYARPGLSAQRFQNHLTALAAIGAGALISLLANKPATEFGSALMGASWQSCSARIVLLSLPLIAALIIAVRQQAPVHLREAGAAIGLFSGATASVIYALTCTEASASFVLPWYSLGISVASAIGAFIGPKLLRW